MGRLLPPLVLAGGPKVSVIVNVPSYCTTVLPSEVVLKLAGVGIAELCAVRHEPLDALAVDDLAIAETAVVRPVLVLHEDIAGIVLVVNEDPLR